MSNAIQSIPRLDGIVSEFSAVVASNKTLSSQLCTLADHLAAQVEALKLPSTSKCAMVEATYAKEFTALAEDRNVVATLRALIVSRVAGAMPVEVKARTTDKAGKPVAAVFTPAKNLNASQAKKFAAEIKADMREAEQTPAEKAEAAKKAAEAKKAADEAAAAVTKAAMLSRQAEAFAFALSDGCRAELVRRLAIIGYKLVKCSPKQKAEAGATPE